MKPILRFFLWRFYFMKTPTNLFLLVGMVFISMGVGDKYISNTSVLQMQFVSNNAATHYGKCIQLKLFNQSQKSIDCRIPAGFQLKASDSTFQNMVLTQGVFVRVMPNQRKDLFVFAMCTEPADKAPSNEVINYTQITTPNKNLSSLCDLIAKEKWHTNEAQQAVWCLVENRSLQEIVGFDTLVIRKLQNKVAQLTKQKMPPPPSKTDYVRNYHASEITMKIKVGGSYSFNFSRTKSVQIAMFNNQNVLVRELYKNNQELPGRKTINYAFDASIYKDPIYYMRLFVDGEKRLETKMDLN